MTKKIAFIIFAILCISVGLYPLFYFVIDRTFGLLSSKSDILLSDVFWNIGFYTHILLGGFALLIGWIQFSKKIRTKNLKFHRAVGKAYVIAVILSGFASLYIAYFATGGIVAILGFLGLGILWLFTTVSGYAAIRKGNVIKHQKYMIYSYAACFGAVTLRIWLPTLMAIFQDFIVAYRIVAWLAWVPNIIVAYVMVKRLGLNNA